MPDNNIDFDVEKSDNELECTNNPLSADRYPANASLVISNLLELAPGEDNETRHILFDEKWEELAFPRIFFKGEFGYTFPNGHYLTTTKYFN